MAGGSPSVLVLASLFTNSAATGTYVQVNEAGQPISLSGPDLSNEVTQILLVEAVNENDELLPQRLADDMVARLEGVTARDIGYLREWMAEARLKASLFSSAVQYMAQMNQENLTFAAARRTPVDKDRVLTLYSGEENLFWLGNNNPEVRVFLTRGDEVRELLYGQPQRIRPGDVFTYGDFSGEFAVVQHTGAFYHTDTPEAVRLAEKTGVHRRR